MCLPARRTALAPLLLVCAMFITGCATEAPTSRPGAAPAAVRFNLAGYSASFKQGYADACASPKRRSEERFKSDTDYRMGWQDGQSLCKK